MALFKFRRTRPVKARRKRGAAPLFPEPLGLSIPARRVNRVVAIVALLGAVGTVALAIALTPGAQTSPSRANASQATLALSEVEAPAQAAERASPPSPPMPVVAALPQRAAKSDRLVSRHWATRTAAAEPVADRQPLRGPVQDQAGEREFAMPSGKRAARGDLVIVAKPDLKSDIERVSSEPPAPGDLRADSADEATPEPGTATLAGTSAEDIAEASLAAIAAVNEEASVGATADEGSEVTDEVSIEATADEGSELTDEESAEITEQASLEPSDEVLPIPAPKPEVATRLAPVTADVNMRAKPQNGSKTITVVPRRSNVEVIGCDYWCEVIYQGKRGWIYKSFIRRTKS